MSNSLCSMTINVLEGQLRWATPMSGKPGRWVFFRREKGRWIPSPMPKRLKKEYSNGE